MPRAAEEDDLLQRLATLTPEEREADRKTTMAELERLKGEQLERLEPASSPVSAPDAEELSSIMRRVHEQLEARQRARMSLPCFRAMYPFGQEPDDPSERVEDVVGKRACEAVGAWKSCPWEGYSLCPKERAGALLEQTRRNLVAARVPLGDSRLFLAAIRDAASALKPYDPLQVVRAVIRREPRVVKLEQGAEWLSSRTYRSGEVRLKGVEKIVVLAGNVGRGKTVAAEYALARLGGLYTTEYAFARHVRSGGIDVAEACAAQVLVIDQFGRATMGDHAPDYALRSIEEVIDHRIANGRLTLLVGNVMTDREFERRFQGIILDRVFGYGVFVVFKGPSVRLDFRRDEESP